LADPLRQNIRGDGFLPGRFNHDWQPKMDWSCLTGAVQIAHCWFLLFGITNDVKYRDTARSTNQFARSTIVVDRLQETAGGVRGSFPVDAEHGRFEFLNWAAKFCIDANLEELDVEAMYERKSSLTPATHASSTTRT
jgi:hypothetical protein